jgi:anti-sigma factor RsiW
VTVDELQRFRRGELSSEDVTSVSRHLVSCPDCASLSRQQIGAESAAATMRALLEAETTVDHPDVETVLSAYVDETLSSGPRLLVDAHLEECAICREDVADLRDERHALQAHRRHAIASWLIAAGVAGIALAGAFLWMTQRDDDRVRPQPKMVRVPMTTPPAKPAGYSRSDWDRLVGDARARGSVAMPAALLALQAEPDELRGASKPVRGVIFSPSSAIVESTRPELRWPATEGARYVVAIFRDDQEVARSKLLATPSWVPPTLARGATYGWQVEVRRNGEATTIPAPPDPPATFAVMDVKSAAAIDDARRQFPEDHLLAALLYARAGVRDSALRELESWTSAHPDDRRAAEILSSIRDW